VSGWLFLVAPTIVYANETGGSEQVVVSPAQQAVNTAQIQLIKALKQFRMLSKMY